MLHALEQQFPGKVRQPVAGMDFFLVSDFDKFAGLDAATFLGDLDASVPVRHAGDDIVPGALQWVAGDHPSLRYRGNELKRRKIWLQDGSVEEFVLVYGYTGFTWPVARATSDWAGCEPVQAASAKVNEMAAVLGAPPVNHAIVTAYDGGSHNIGFHYDKAHSLDDNTLIAVLKLGPASRPFALRRRVGQDLEAQAAKIEAAGFSKGEARQKAKQLAGKKQEAEPCVFNEVVPAGTLILMSMEANLATQHAVPAVEDEKVGLSGSIVWRRVYMAYSQGILARKIAATERGSAKRQADKAAAAAASKLTRTSAPAKSRWVDEDERFAQEVEEHVKRAPVALQSDSE